MEKNDIWLYSANNMTLQYGKNMKSGIAQNIQLPVVHYG